MRRLPSLLVLLGIPRVLSGQAACPAPWTLKEVLTIGAVDGPQALSEVNDFEIGPDGRIYVTQFMTPYVSVFDGRGKAAGTIGRAGLGPGEFDLAAMRIGFRGDTLWARDRSALHFLLADGREARQLEWRTPVPREGSAFVPTTPLADGSFLGERVLTGGPGTSPDNFFSADHLPLLRFDRAGAILDTIATVTWSQPRSVQLPGRGKIDHPLQGMGSALTPGIESRLPVVTTPDYRAVLLIGGIETTAPKPTLLNLGGLIGKATGTFELLRIGITGDTLLKASIAYEPQAISASLQAWLRESFAAQVAGDFTRRDPRAPGAAPSSAVREQRRADAAEAITFPAFLPPVRHIVAGHDGTIWLLRELREDREDHWEVYDPRGRLQGTVVIAQGRWGALPWLPHLRILLATRDEVWGVTIDDLDVPTIHKYRVVRTCG